jgi:DNA-binding transcriptional ArsR family regulator
VQALSILSERSASPKELSAALGAPVANVSYHVRELENMELIELVEEKKRRGAVEHFYRATPRPLVSEADWRRLSLADRHAISASIIQMLLADASRSLAALLFDARIDRRLSRTQLTVDEKGWAELVEIQDEALKAILAVQAASADRLAETGGDGFEAIAALACFELPPNQPRPKRDS